MQKKNNHFKFFSKFFTRNYSQYLSYFIDNPYIRQLNPPDCRSTLTKKLFQDEYFQKKPIIVTNGLNWNAFEKWSFNYIAQSCAYAKANLYRFNINDEYQREKIDGVTISEAIKTIQSNSSEKNFKYYVLRQSIPTYFPHLLNDIQFPSWHNIPDRYDTNLWLGEAGNKTPLHYDAVENFLIQIKGEKEIILLPQENEFLPVNSPFTGGRFNFSPVKFLETRKGLEVLNKNHGNSFRCILKPGNVLYIPKGWWHQVNTTSAAISVNYWFAGKVYNSFKNYLLDYQATSLHNKNFPKEISDIINNCTFDNCLSTAEKLNQLNCYSLARIVCAAFLEEILKTLQRLYLPPLQHTMKWPEIIKQVADMKSEVFISEMQVKLWEIILADRYEDVLHLDKATVSIMIKSVNDYFNLVKSSIENCHYLRLS